MAGESHPLKEFVYTRDITAGAIRTDGIVAEFKQPRTAGGTDMKSTIVITDESDSETSFVTWRATEEEHPHPEPGNIAIIIDAKVNLFRGQCDTKANWSINLHLYDPYRLAHSRYQIAGAFGADIYNYIRLRYGQRNQTCGPVAVTPPPSTPVKSSAMNSIRATPASSTASRQHTGTVQSGCIDKSIRLGRAPSSSALGNRILQPGRATTGKVSQGTFMDNINAAAFQSSP